MTTPPSSLPPANWYPDPQTPGQLRYWDGQRWTQHVHPAQQPAQGVSGVAQPQAGPGVFLPSGRPGNTQPGQGAAPTQGVFTPTQGAGGPARNVFTPTQAAGGPAQGGFTPVPAAAAAGPATGAQPLAQQNPMATGPATGSQRTFQPGSAGASAPLYTPTPSVANYDVDDIPRGQGGHNSYNSLNYAGTSRKSQLALLFGFLTLLTTGISIYGLGTDFDAYVTYAAGGIGFVSVLFGFAGVGRSLRGEGGRARSFFAIGAGFLAIGLNTYEYLYPRELYDVIVGLFSG